MCAVQHHRKARQAFVCTVTFFQYKNEVSQVLLLLIIYLSNFNLIPFVLFLIMNFINNILFLSEYRILHLVNVQYCIKIVTHLIFRCQDLLQNLLDNGRSHFLLLRHQNRKDYQLYLADGIYHFDTIF